MMVNILDKDFTMTTSSSDILEILKSRIDNPLYNTSYPLQPSDWAMYNVEGELPFDMTQPLAYYIHIPFCERLCKFCEYCRIIIPSGEVQSVYIKTLRSDINSFLTKSCDVTLYGFDIGGGTPTAINDQAFAELIGIYKDIVDRLSVTPDFEPSIEGTFDTLTPQKAQLIANAGIHRVSLGVQSSSESVLHPLNRKVTDVESMRHVLDYVRKAGIGKINLDLMYGLPCQTLDSIRHDIHTIASLRPEQVTVYELRTNQLKTDYKINNDLSFGQYSLLYEELTKLGYYSEFGQNTFSLDSTDKGLSSYLRHRMFDGWQYKGFGISAQSMSNMGLAYNPGKDGANLSKILESGTYESDYHYALPQKEVFAKYVAISGYSGGFSISSARRIYGSNFDSDFSAIISELQTERLIKINGDRLQLTQQGYHHYGAILSLFYI